VKDRPDPEAAALQQSMNPELVLAALDEDIGPDKHLQPAEDAKEDVRMEPPLSN
jgi:hypothetical protein